MALIDKCRMALRVTTTAYDDEINEYINAAKKDLTIAGVIVSTSTATPDDSLIDMAVMTYVRAHFGSPTDYDRLKGSYDEQKGQLMKATGYTDWGVE